MKKSVKIFLGLAFIAVLTVVVWWRYFPDAELKEPVGDFLISFSHTTKEIITPPPLRGNVDSSGAALTASGVIKWTNSVRSEGNLPSLAENFLLDEAAKLKLNDMLDGQYFEHISPSGTGVSMWAKEAGYDYIVIGENLAMGDFSGDKDLVEAWMNSPGHRENILSDRYEQIGAAVGRGVFDGRLTWLAVQIFGLPASACPQPDSALKSRIETHEYNLKIMEQNIALLRNEIKNLKPRGRSGAGGYSELVGEYNKLVSQYNSSVGQMKEMVNVYNQQVKSFNSCAEGQ